MHNTTTQELATPISMLGLSCVCQVHLAHRTPCTARSTIPYAGVTRRPRPERDQTAVRGRTLDAPRTPELPCDHVVRRASTEHRTHTAHGLTPPWNRAPASGSGSAASADGEGDARPDRAPWRLGPRATSVRSRLTARGQHIRASHRVGCDASKVRAK